MKILLVSAKFTRHDAVLDALPPEETVLMVDMDRCISCGSCQFACQAERTGDGGKAGPKAFPTRLKSGPASAMRLPLSCRHCPDPCVYGEPYNFWTTCPAGKAPAADACDGCAPRLAKGLTPACVTRCSMKCLYFGTAQDMRFALAEKRLRDMGDVVIACGLEG